MAAWKNKCLTMNMTEIIQQTILVQRIDDLYDINFIVGK